MSVDLHEPPVFIVVSDDEEIMPPKKRRRLQTIQSDDEREVDAKPTAKIFPADYYVVDVVNYFEYWANEQAKGRKGTGKGKHAVTLAELCFKEKFPDHVWKSRDGTFPSSTIYDNRARWLKASEAERTRYLGYGQTTAGLWKKFGEHNKAVGADLKSARKRQRQRKQIKADEDEDEDD
jgi:hypothetical protein